MTIQIIVQTTSGPIIGTPDHLTGDEIKQLRSGLENLFSEKVNYLTIDTETGWVIVPGDKIIFVQAMVEE